MKRDADQQHFWEFECAKWRGRVLRGPDAHYCCDWDFLPVDATTPEYSCCVCFSKTKWGRFVNRIYMAYFNFFERYNRGGF